LAVRRYGNATPSLFLRRRAGGKSGKTPPATIKAAKKVYGEYQKAKKAGTLELVEIDGEEDED
jgi:hypothetical protein